MLSICSLTDTLFSMHVIGPECGWQSLLQTEVGCLLNAQIIPTICRITLFTGPENSLLLSFVSLISVLGVTLGVLILIVALAVINGSIETLRKEALKSTPHVTIAGPGLQANWRELRDVALGSEESLPRPRL